MKNYAVTEIRPDGEWVVFLMKNNCSLRLFRTEAEAVERYGSKAIGVSVYPHFTHLIRGMNGREMVKIFNELAKVQNGDSTGREGTTHENVPDIAANSPIILAERLWALCQQVGVKNKPSGQAAVSQSESPGRNYEFKFDRAKMLSPEGQEIIATYSVQKRGLIDALIFAQLEVVKRLKLKDIVNQLKADGHFKTKSKPWTIFSYYAPEFAEDGFVVYHGLRHKEKYGLKNMSAK